MLAVCLGAAILLLAAAALLDHTTNQTANGLWKLHNLRLWTERDPARMIEPANLLYFPACGAFARAWAVFDPAESLRGRVTYFNAVAGGLALGFFFLLVHRLTASRTIALVATLFHLGCAFFLLLTTICEDIMQAYTFFVGALALLVLYAQTNRALWLFLGVQCFVLSWLFHWTMAVAGPALWLAVVALPGSLKCRTGRGLAFLACCLLLPVLCSELLNVRLTRIIWPGKGLDSGWVGWSTTKLLYFPGGLAQYLVGGRNIVALGSYLSPGIFAANLLSWTIGLALALVLVRRVWADWQQPAWRLSGVALGGTFVLGELMNLYHQPQDPQFQIQPMAWLPVAFAVLLLRWRSSALRYGCGIALALLPLLVNGLLFASERGGDRAHLTALRQLAEAADPAETLFVTHGFDYLPPWGHVAWDRRHLLLLSDPAVHQPRQSAEESVRRLHAELDKGLAAYRQVVIGPVWDMNEAEFADSYRTVRTVEQSRVLYRALKDSYDARLLVRTGWGNFYQLSRKSERDLQP